jgi:ACR3 family arsenite efflux pump ArsB
MVRNIQISIILLYVMIPFLNHFLFIYFFVVMVTKRATILHQLQATVSFSFASMDFHAVRTHFSLRIFLFASSRCECQQVH